MSTPPLLLGSSLKAAAAAAQGLFPWAFAPRTHSILGTGVCLCTPVLLSPYILGTRRVSGSGSSGNDDSGDHRLKFVWDTYEGKGRLLKIKETSMKCSVWGCSSVECVFFLHGWLLKSRHKLIYTGFDPVSNWQGWVEVEIKSGNVPTVDEDNGGYLLSHTVLKKSVCSWRFISTSAREINAKSSLNQLTRQDAKQNLVSNCKTKCRK